MAETETNKVAPSNRVASGTLMTSPQSSAWCPKDYLDRKLYPDERLGRLGQLWYRQSDRLNFLEFVRFLCLNQANAQAVLKMLGAQED
ncbi:MULTISPECIES: hypothetical protein [Loigolactobacillus]|uniref:Uncharacterized protein n=1 Tax=Loigolactobacillus backii TaxID=375175 RepID=A0A192H152_9LACO|nr:MULTISPECIES: hypothetical protein [Loigolactobacillus]ANK59132.1 hypothetical protein AYR52_01935 [Loigolactobacillus backii]ANK62534.1 hypothetical protein AYR53_06995 [Loigolactobacillus backii]ANK64121.1 hypothetical protein AYR54_01925 [Loigolactobacillus backii]ANK67485.1 hypothetical protein AYR55_07115 [Loigolactobacillus backii]ANK70455.1 hypothetical protein AYR56_10005 [Loigolactobacillus backii]